MNEEIRNPGTGKLDWSKLDEMTDIELAALVESTIFVLSDKSGVELPKDMPASAMTKALVQSFNDRGMDAGTAHRIVKETKLSRPLAIVLLQEIAAEPALAQEIERVWYERSGMLVVGADVILAAALLLLVLKLKTVKINKETGFEVDFYKLSKGILGSVFKFLGM